MLGQRRKVDILEGGLSQSEGGTGGLIRQHANQCATRAQLGGDDIELILHLSELALIDEALPQPSIELVDQDLRLPFQQNLPFSENRHAGTEIGDILHDVCGGNLCLCKLSARFSQFQFMSRNALNPVFSLIYLGSLALTRISAYRPISSAYVGLNVGTRIRRVRQTLKTLLGRLLLFGSPKLLKVCEFALQSSIPEEGAIKNAETS